MLQHNGTPFSIGRSRFTDRAEASEGQTAKIWIRVEPSPLGSVILAQLDTGAPWTVLNAEIADALSLLNGDGEQVRMSTREGAFNGRLERTTIDIIADEGEGESLSINATVWVSQDWPGGTFLGYGGLLERVKFAIDPTDNFFYFGPG